MKLDFTIKDSYDLPSMGKIYKQPFDPHIEMKSMNTYHEMIRLNNNVRSFENMANIMDECILTETPFSSYDFCIGDFQFLLHRLRILTYGDEYPLMTVCPLCGTRIEDKIQLSQLGVVKWSDDLKKYMDFTLPVSKLHITTKYQTPRILDDIKIDASEYKKKYTAFKGDPTLLFTLKRCIETINDEKPDPLEVEEIIRNLPAKDSRFILANIDKVTNGVGVDTNLSVVCDNCGLTYNSTFRITGEFFSPSIDID